MAGLTEDPAWIGEIYQIEKTDPVVAGPPDFALKQGVTNIPHKQLADRTAWLKQKLETLEQLLNDLTNGAPGALDTLNELAAALGDDPNFAATILGKVADAAPKGIVAPFAMTAPPTGWLECNGAQLSRTSYAALFAAIGTTFGAGNGSTTFHLPDLRGEFVRGWDHGRGTDGGRGMGTAQSHQIAQIYMTRDSGATVPPNSSDTDYHPSPGSISNSGVMKMSGTGPGNETRPRNVALMFCIKF